MKRYRYILANCKISDSIAQYRLVSSAYIGTVAREPGRVYIRVWIPDDMKLVKHSSDIYSTTDDARTIKELGYDLVMTQWTGKRKVISIGADLGSLADEQRRLYLKHSFGDRERIVKEAKV
jgi:hypothetical protein